ncbi:MAG TPA: Stp1/IreP family PP2C-type Ser/Thr phosphatase [Polyangiaceae bacterium]|nr:Stp1/IreP family PP2C-type Ser/Thr phosphatase [Polyangiaceae bacterium]
MTTKIRLRAVAAGMSDVGLQRDHNEDSLVIVGTDGPFVVADGMGGHRAGDVASRLATEAIAEHFQSRTEPQSLDRDARFTDEENRLLTSIRTANRRILERSLRSKELQGMGTTVVCALFVPESNRMVIAHVGDSRAYRLRGGFLTQMTRDHSLFNDYLMAMPDLSEEQRSELPRNVITRALGMQDDIPVDLQSDDVAPGDMYVLCSDGLSGMVEDEEIIAALASASDLEQACRLLVRRANENGGEDNVTALLIRVDRADSTGAVEPTSPRNTLPTAGSGSDESNSARGGASRIGGLGGTDDTPPAARVSNNTD